MTIPNTEIRRVRAFRGLDAVRGIHRTNTEGTCLYCGAKLRPAKHRDDGRLGAYADNAFCTMRCGYAFGVAAASNAFRLARTELVR